MTKTWVITGASSGLGLDMARQLLAKGDSVVATTRRADLLSDLQRQYGDRLDVVRLDLTAVSDILSGRST